MHILAHVRVWHSVKGQCISRDCAGRCCYAHLVEHTDGVGVRVCDAWVDASWRSVGKELCHLGPNKIVIYIWECG